MCVPAIETKLSSDVAQILPLGLMDNSSLCKKLNQKSAASDRIVKRKMYFTSTRYVFASLFVLSFSIQSETYIEHDPNFAFLFVSPTFSLFLLLFLCAFFLVYGLIVIRWLFELWAK